MTTTSQAEGFLDALVGAHATLRPDAPALLSRGRATCTYEELARHLDRAGTVLAQALPAANSVIAVAAANGPELLTAIVAVMSRGICAPFDSRRPPAEIEAFLDDITPSLVLADEEAIRRHGDALKRYGVRVVRMITEPAAPAGVFELLPEEPYPDQLRVSGLAADVALLVRTSGTTARAKIIPHTRPRLMHIFTSIVDTLQLQPADRCFNARPLQHVHAIAHVIGASLVAGASIVCPTEISAAALVDGLRSYTPSWYSASPAVHRDVLAYAGAGNAPLEHALRFIRSSSAALDAQVAIDLEALFGVPVLQGYGTSEAPSIALNPPPPAAHKPGSVGRTVGCEIAIVAGEVTVRGANVAPSYADGAHGAIIDPATGWFHTGDAGYIDADGYLFLTGRLNELINVGGEKVAPSNVEAALLAHPAVADAIAFPLPHPTLGEHVAAAVVRRAGASVTEAELIAHAARLLARQAVPNVVHLLPAITRDGNGKVRRRDLTATFARPAPTAQAAPSQAKVNALFRALARIWEDILAYAPVQIDENFFAAGGDSLRAIRVMMRVEADLGVVLPPDTLLFAPTIRKLAEAILAQANGTNRERVVTLRATGSRPPLFFFDGDINGGGLYTRFLLAALEPEQPVYVVHPHGVAGDAIPESIELMGDADAAMIATTVPSQTYRLAGYCNGGNVAFEVARCLEAAGYRVDVVALIGSSAPNAGLELLWTLTRGVTPVYRFARSIVNAIRTQSAPTEILNAIRDRAQPPLVLPAAMRTYSQRLVRYFPQRSARWVDVIWALDDRPRISGDPSMGWRHVAHVRRHSVNGDHTTMLTDHAGELGAVLAPILAAADAG